LQTTTDRDDRRRPAEQTGGSGRQESLRRHCPSPSSPTREEANHRYVDVDMVGSQSVITATFDVAKTTQYFNKNVTSAFSACHGVSFTPGFCLTYPWVTR
jgi:hypothetical protein